MALGGFVYLRARLRVVAADFLDFLVTQRNHTMPPPRMLLVEQMQRLGAKAKHIEEFTKAFGASVLVTESFDLVAPPGFPVNWAVHNLLTPKGVSQFYELTEDARRDNPLSRCRSASATLRR